MLTALLCLLPTIAHSQAIEAWVQRYNGPGNGNDFLHAMAVDASGNVYVAGTSDSGFPSADDWVVIAYSCAGVPLWTNRFSGPGTRQDNARDLALDATGSVIVTGSSSDASGYSHCTTIKYSSAGVPLWTNLYAVSGSGGRYVALDADGNIFVAGSVGGVSSDYLTIKYSSAGDLLWAKTYSGGGSVFGIAVDANGDAFVTGSCPGTFGGDYLTIKYSSTGTWLWARRYTGPPDLDDPVQALAVDASGDVYVTGSSDGGGGDWDYATVKYSGAGVPLWTNRYSGPGTSRSDWARAIAVDLSGNVIVTGWASAARCATIKYSSTGVPLWTNLHTAGDAYAIAIDRSENIYVTGNSEGGSKDWDYLTIAYSGAGIPLWTNRYNGPANGGDVAKKIAVDANGNVYVAGSVRDTNFINSDIATIKYVVPPIIAGQPLSCTNAVGTTASFTVEATGGLPLSFQWRRQGTNLLNGGNISGVTTTNLLVANVQLADAAGYSVVITNAYGSTTSSVAQLTVVSSGRFTNFSYSPVMGFSFIFRDASIGLPVRIQRSSSLAEGSWSNWQSFTYTEPMFLVDLGATGQERRFYRAISP